MISWEQIERVILNRIAKVILVGLVPATFVIYLWGFLVTCADKNGEIQNDAYDFITWVSFILFAFNGISFILVGINLRIQLRKWNEDIERRNRAKISFSMLILSIPFLIRAGYILVRLNIDMESKINKSIEDDDYFAPIFSFVYIWIADLIPITAQLSSMLVVINREDRGRENETTEDHIRDTENEYYGSFVNKGSKNRKINGSADSKTLRLINGSREFSADAIQFKSSLSNKVLESDRENSKFFFSRYF